jgi:AhpC/TSA family
MTPFLVKQLSVAKHSFKVQEAARGWNVIVGEERCPKRNRSETSRNLWYRVRKYCPMKGKRGNMLAHRIKRLFLSGVLLAGVLGTAGVATALEIGEKAPDFTLPSTTGKDISLSEFLGKKYVLIEFYGADFNPV